MQELYYFQESEVQVPKPRSCTPPPTDESQEPRYVIRIVSLLQSFWNSNYDDNDSTAASTATADGSKDEWEGLTQAHPPPISDSVCASTHNKYLVRIALFSGK